MKNNYKTGLVDILMAVLMISAQGVEAKHPSKTKQTHHKNYEKFYVPRMMIVKHQGRVFLFTSGKFYRRGYDEFFAVKAPIGTRVKHLPRGTQRIHSPNGWVYKYNQISTKRLGGGWVLCNTAILFTSLESLET